MEQLYFAVTRKEDLPKTRKPGSLSMSYEQALAAGIIKQPATPSVTEEELRARMRSVFEKSRGRQKEKQAPAGPSPEEPRRRGRRRGK